jgi:hypothetical protein
MTKGERMRCLRSLFTVTHARLRHEERSSILQSTYVFDDMKDHFNWQQHVNSFQDTRLNQCSDGHIRSQMRDMAKSVGGCWTLNTSLDPIKFSLCVAGA